MNTSTGMFQVTQESGTAVVSPSTELSELDYQRLVAGAEEVLDELDRLGADKVVIDLQWTDHFDYAALTLFARLWKKEGREMVLCGVSEHEREVLKDTQQDRPWPICASRRQAIEWLHNSAAASREDAEDTVEEASTESFPASDPPAWTPITRP